eukprot:TRINITY_DN1475_c4_g2_i1.p1 TRINITY_DN1475_c4_g2~~TRINITY_DN1475_c4_g2_i1.p1  ORF type:complete len:264 (-),score=84.90 TRINITY_DN1475_c4_g2_i1:122-886(-)
MGNLLQACLPESEDPSLRGVSKEFSSGSDNIIASSSGNSNAFRESVNRDERNEEEVVPDRVKVAKRDVVEDSPDNWESTNDRVKDFERPKSSKLNTSGESRHKPAAQTIITPETIEDDDRKGSPEVEQPSTPPPINVPKHKDYVARVKPAPKPIVQAKPVVKPSQNSTLNAKPTPAPADDDFFADMQPTITYVKPTVIEKKPTSSRSVSSNTSLNNSNNAASDDSLSSNTTSRLPVDVEESEGGGEWGGEDGWD